MRVQKFFHEPSLTRQAHKDQCDVKKIVKRFRDVNGYNPLLALTASGGTYGDFSAVPDYRSAIEQVRSADESFMKLPAKVRQRFGNDVASFLDFIDHAPREELYDIGLLERPLEPAALNTEAQKHIST